MPLEKGTRLGAYRITGLLATGGMGEVYTARDERLGRDVAVKVVARGLAEDAKEHARFEREARTLASLSHPNILNIFDFGEEGGFRYAVTELLTGQNLRERMAGRALPWRTAVAIAIGAAKGLAAAHAGGIVHRDLKPENIFLLADGGVKVLDFGLARAVSGPAHQFEDESLVGTAAYMAPEQIVDQPTDARTDVFALGVVLHEMLTGDKPFGRATVTMTMDAILSEEPPPIPTGANTVPLAAARVVRRCLEKEPAQRWQTAYDVAFALSDVIAVVAPAPAAPVWRGRALWFLAGLLLGSAVTALVALLR
jgi:serine/threonine protein kinase